MRLRPNGVICYGLAVATLTTLGLAAIDPLGAMAEITVPTPKASAAEIQRIMFGDIAGELHFATAKILKPVFVIELPARRKLPDARDLFLPAGCEGLGSVVSQLGRIAGRCVVDRKTSSSMLYS